MATETNRELPMSLEKAKSFFQVAIQRCVTQKEVDQVFLNFKEYKLPETFLSSVTTSQGWNYLSENAHHVANQNRLTALIQNNDKLMLLPTHQLRGRK